MRRRRLAGPLRLRARDALEAGVLAICRAVNDPPDECFEYEDPIGEGLKPTALSPADVGSNAGMLRDDAQTLLVLITDEGDGSYRLATGDTDICPTTDILDSFDSPVRLAVVGPVLRGRRHGLQLRRRPALGRRALQNACDCTGRTIDIEAPDENGELRRTPTSG